MSNRAATILAVAAVISSLCLYATFAQEPREAPEPADGAIVIGLDTPAAVLPAQEPILVESAPSRTQELPGRYLLSTSVDNSRQTEVIVLDTHTGRCWSKMEGHSSWKDWGSPVKQK